MKMKCKDCNWQGIPKKCNMVEPITTGYCKLVEHWVELSNNECDTRLAFRVIEVAIANLIETPSSSLPNKNAAEKTVIDAVNNFNAFMKV